MATRTSSGKSTKGRTAGNRSRNRESTQSQSIGGREFGEVVEPMQAQMASGNCGLAEDSGEQEEPERLPTAA